MVEKKIKFVTSGQLMSFCNTCQKMKSDIDVTDMANRNFRIDGKSLLGLMSIKLGLPMRLIINGEDEEMAHQYFTKYEMRLQSRDEPLCLSGDLLIQSCPAGICRVNVHPPPSVSLTERGISWTLARSDAMERPSPKCSLSLREPSAR